MKLIQSSYSILEQKPGLDGIYEQIELAGRTCYASSHKIQYQENETCDGQFSITARGFVDRMIASQHCYTGESMVLTEIGWIPWKNYKGEKVAVVNSNGSFRGFETPSRVLKHEYSGKFYYYPALGLKVTDGHRMYGLFRESKNDFYNSTSYNTFVCNQSYKDNNGREKTLGERMFKVPKHCVKPIHSNPFYELVGFWLGDGCYQPQTVNKLVFHLKKNRKIQYLKDLCEELGYNFEVGADNYYRVCYPNIGKKFNSLFYNKNGKTIPPMYMSSNSVAVKSIINGLINSDGSIGINTKTITYTSTSLDIILWVLNVGAIGGFTVSNLKLYDWNDPKCKRVFKIFLLDTDYTINNDSRNPDSKVLITEETQEVYCVTVSTGLILVKGENGVTSICGNCAMLEHGTVYLKISAHDVNCTDFPHIALDSVIHSTYSKVNNDPAPSAECIYITTNYRVLVENDALSLLEYFCEPTEFHEKRVTVRFTTDRGVSHEFVRHRVFSFAQESTRYCNYSKDKFGNELTFVIPSWSYKKTAVYNGIDNFDGDYFEHSLIDAESYYFDLLKQGWTPQQARQVLPNALKTELVMTGFISDWNHFFDLRAKGTTGQPHPDAKALAEPLMREFIERKLIEE